MDLSRFTSELSFRNKLLRAVWHVVWLLLFRPSPRPLHAWRRFILRVFGARLGRGVKVYGSARIFYPPNLEMGDYSVLGPDVDCYCVDRIQIGENAIVSQYSFLCTATHDYHYTNLPLTTSPIVL